MKIPLAVEEAIRRGFVVSMWRQSTKSGREFACEISKPAWAGSVLGEAKSMKKAVRKAWSAATDLDLNLKINARLAVPADA